MQGPPTPTENDQASLPTEHALSGPHLSAGSRKAAMHTFPWKLTAEELQLELSQPLQDEDEDIRETKRPRLEEPFFASTNEATTENTLQTTAVALPPAAATASASAADTAADHADSDPVMDIHPNAGTTRDTRCWTLDEDAQLISAVTKTCKKKWGKELRIDWVAVAELIPGRTYIQCRSRWHGQLVSNIDPTTARSGRWTADEDKKLRDAVREHGGKNWKAIAAFVPDRTPNQCYSRWCENIVDNMDPATALAGKWTADEDKKLRDAVREHGGKNWKAITALVPGRTQRQCRTRWYDTLGPKIDPTMALAGKWTADEDKKLKDGVREHGGKNWKAIAAFVPGRTRDQCRKRWQDTLGSNIDPATALAGKWTADEDKNLSDAVGAHGGKNWKAIATLVLGRTRDQCRKRWQDTLGSNIDPATALAGRWTADEDKNLSDAVGAYGGKNWKAIATLVPGRTQTQCRSRWHDYLVSNIDPKMALAGKWTADEDNKLRDSVREHGGKNWDGITALVPGRTQFQCRNRWHDTLVSNIDQTTLRKGAWIEDEDSKLKYAVQKYGGTEWDAIAALVPSRTRTQCRKRWHDFLKKT
jgi:hypothetical protein